MSMFQEPSAAANNFTKRFFEHVGKRSPAMVGPETTVVWNGIPLSGDSAFSHLLHSTPEGNYRIQGAQAVPLASQQPGAAAMAIQANGTVKFGDGHPRDTLYGYSAYFIVDFMGLEGPFNIRTLDYRLIQTPDELPRPSQNNRFGHHR